MKERAYQMLGGKGVESAPDKVDALSQKVCIYCANRTQEVCVSRCQSEGKYRYLSPEPLPAWEAPPELPPFREFVDMPAPLKLAYLYLVAHYQRLIVDG